MTSEIELLEVPVTSIAWRQLGILVLDGSVSMTDPVESGVNNRSKAEEVNIAIRDMLSRFKVSRKAPNFSFALVTHHDKTTFAGPITAVVDIDDNGNYDPTFPGTGGTFIGSGLESAQQIADEFLSQDSQGLPSSVVVLVLSDGECGSPDRTQAIADKLKADKDVTVATAFLATKGQSSGNGPALLQTICSDSSKFYKTVYDGETLRAFFMASMTAAANVDDGSLR